MVVDVETTVTDDDPRAYLPDNKLVSVGWYVSTLDVIKYQFAYHKDIRYKDNLFSVDEFTNDLNSIDILVAHNMKFDLTWLRECDIHTPDTLLYYDTMMYEYIAHQGLIVPLSLNECVKRRGIEGTKDDEVSQMFKNGLGYDEIPLELVERYGRQDVHITHELYKRQLQELYQ